MIIEITCPDCGFSKTVSKANIPESVKFVNCPQCGARIQLNISNEENQIPSKEMIITHPIGNHSGLDSWNNIFHPLRSTLLLPKKFFSDMRLGNGIGESFLFGFLIGSIGTMFEWFWQFLIISGKSEVLGNTLPDLILSNLNFYVVLILCPLFIIIKMFFVGGIVHLSLIILRGAQNGFEGTFKVIAYSQSAQMFSIIPFIGGITGFIWQIIIVLIGLKRIHHSSSFKIIFALFLPFGFLIVISLAIILSASIFLSC